MASNDKRVVIDIDNESHLTLEQQTYREKRIASFHISIANLEAEVALMAAQLAEIKARLKHDPSAIVRQHIRLLHKYNEIKDIGQGLVGLIADARGVRQVEVQREYGVGDRD
ncbi:Swi5-domain-containing protein [Aspergillus bertholletiae]|uniref:Swi5-domain-containing protein n=1 Tax=Aspergillus bertholletiae TaxID=1226010 RepID=A0A5N7BKR2_9EURO|nr:Swi5-domain-containing protein [Aspergillus bertholletiae]